jgi:hypothetical protein
MINTDHNLNRDMKKFLVLSFIVTFGLQQSTVASDLLSSQCIDSWKSQMVSLSSMSYVFTFDDYKSTNPTQKNHFESGFKIDFENKKLLSIRENSEDLFTFDSMISVSKFSQNKELEYLIVSMVKVPKDYWNQAFALSYMCYPLGYIKDQEKILFLPEIIDVEKCVCNYRSGEIDLSCNTQQFDINITFIPEKNFAVKQIVVKRVNKIQDTPFKFQECRYVVSEFVLLSESWFPVRYHVEEKYGSGKRQIPKQDQGLEYYIPEENIPERTLFADIVLKNIKFPIKFSDKDFQIAMKIPNGTPVAMQDAPQIQYVWMDGEIVPKTDEVALRIARGNHKFMPSPDEPRFWVIGLGLVLILLSGLLEFRKRIRKKNKS